MRIEPASGVQDHRIARGRGEIDQSCDRCLRRRRGVGWRGRDHSEAGSVREERLHEPGRRHLVHDVDQRRYRMHTVGAIGETEHGLDVAAVGIDVEQHGRAASRRERSGQMGREERAARAAAGTVHRDDLGSPVEDPSRGRERPHVAKELVALDRPDRERADAGADGCPQSRDRLPARDRDAWRRRRDVRREPWLGDHDVGLELLRRLRDLSSVLGGRQHAHGAAAIQEVQDLVEHLRRVDSQDHPRQLLHPSFLRVAAHRHAELSLEEVRGGYRCESLLTPARRTLPSEHGRC